MTRVELIALFTALAKLCEKGDLDGVKEVINVVLQESKSEKKSRKQ